MSNVRSKLSRFAPAVVLGAAGLLFVIPNPASANLVSNASFEANTASAGGFSTYASLPGTGISPWTYAPDATNTFNDGGVLQGTLLSPPCQDGSVYWADLRGNDSLYQSIGTVTDNTSYALSFEQAGQGNSPSGAVTISLWAGVPGTGTELAFQAYSPTATIDYTQPPYNGSTDGSTYTNFALRTATLSTGTGFSGQPLYLQLQQTGTPANNVLLDAVTASVPEPASLSLLALGGLVMLRRRRTA